VEIVFTATLLLLLYNHFSPYPSAHLSRPFFPIITVPDIPRFVGKNDPDIGHLSLEDNVKRIGTVDADTTAFDTKES
jgi:hypothetical protein